MKSGPVGGRSNVTKIITNNLALCPLPPRQRLAGRPAPALPQRLQAVATAESLPEQLRQAFAEAERPPEQLQMPFAVAEWYLELLRRPFAVAEWYLELLRRGFGNGESLPEQFRLPTGQFSSRVPAQPRSGGTVVAQPGLHDQSREAAALPPTPGAAASRLYFR